MKYWSLEDYIVATALVVVAVGILMGGAGVLIGALS